MHIISDDDPLLRGARHVGKALTIGNLSAVADGLADTRAIIARSEAALAKLEAAVYGLNKRGDDQAATLEKLRADAAEMIQKVKAEDAKREAQKETVRVWIAAQPDPENYRVLAANNGLSLSECRP
jgi:hypothetical protein